MNNNKTTPNIGDLRIVKIGFSYEVQRYSARNYDGYYCRDWHTITTFWDENEANNYIRRVKQ